jgi:hypothetical protein
VPPPDDHDNRPCPACGYRSDVATPAFDGHARRIRAYLEPSHVPASPSELAVALNIPIGTRYNRWFRARARDFGVQFSRDRGRVSFYLADVPA